MRKKIHAAALSVIISNAQSAERTGIESSTVYHDLFARKYIINTRFCAA